MGFLESPLCARLLVGLCFRKPSGVGERCTEGAVERSVSHACQYAEHDSASTCSFQGHMDLGSDPGPTSHTGLKQGEVRCYRYAPAETLLP